MAILEVKNLHTQFKTQAGIINAINGIDFSIEAGEVLAIVGESGSGKSVTALSVMGLLPRSIASITEGSISFVEVDLTKIDHKQYNRIRGKDISMIFQNPLTALDPYFAIGNQLSEIIAKHQPSLSRKDVKQEASALLRKVGIHDTERVLRAYPHELSGGMRQRVVIALAISSRPKLIIADEPTTALDATIQKQILELLKQINEEYNTAIMIITHDFGVVANISDKVAVMYAGKLVEFGKTEDVIRQPLHPYTKGLIESVPGVTRSVEQSQQYRLPQIEGSAPDLLELSEGCVFFERCPKASTHCLHHNPELTTLSDKRQVACHYPEGVGA
ncbi:ABC transporter ATP-binding protein [Paenibacillus endoradicis]|uniref:ABC transporter ATP-binding protein n=1 Tax=Paenibacillus endoradicis TaxID=2972487 RepID=UPI002158E696|nr:ABC transporter ATP-binding protein [Paenibacillus endoradicis]MCR8655963.1 ABC transporter ATP-binding protein [Paenibacillus endoradicis]MCR8658289.1 ABC transporter ATP-binding protein [Paenibacillus endoradicis]